MDWANKMEGYDFGSDGCPTFAEKLCPDWNPQLYQDCYPPSHILRPEWAEEDLGVRNTESGRFISYKELYGLSENEAVLAKEWKKKHREKEELVKLLMNLPEYIGLHIVAAYLSGQQPVCFDLGKLHGTTGRHGRL
jgi:hypothetical protein